MQSALVIYASTQVTLGLPASYPATLDGVTGAIAGTLATGSTPMFSNVLQGGVTAQWLKLASGTCYAFDEDSSGTVSAGDLYFRYLPGSGIFTEIATCS